MTTGPPTPQQRRALNEGMGEHVRGECHRRGIDLETLRTRLEVSEEALEELLQGHTPWTLNDLLLTADVLGVSLSDLTGSVQPPPPD